MNDNKKFKEVNIEEYVKDGIDNGTLEMMYVQKTTKVFARPGIPGEIIHTLTSNGVDETIKIVNVDENGIPDWVITNASKEEYAIPKRTFIKKYKPDMENPNVYIPIGTPLLAMQISENLAFRAPWGSMMFIKSGGYIIVNSLDDIYGIQEEVFRETFEIFDIPSKSI